MNKLVTIALVAIIGLTLASAGYVYISNAANNVVTISSCTVITKSGYYKLTKDLHGAPYYTGEYDGNPFPHVPEPKACIIITVSDVTLDCQGHTIDAGGGQYCILAGYYGKNLRNIRIKNCVLKGARLMEIANSAGGGSSEVYCSNVECPRTYGYQEYFETQAPNIDHPPFGQCWDFSCWGKCDETGCHVTGCRFKRPCKYT